MAIAGLVVGFNLHDGRAWPAALGLGFGAGIVGLAGWWSYHLVGHRNDGLMVVGMFWNPFARGREAPNINLIVTNAVVAVALGILFGMWNRVWPPEGSAGHARSPDEWHVPQNLKGVTTCLSKLDPLISTSRQTPTTKVSCSRLPPRLREQPAGSLARDSSSRGVWASLAMPRGPGDSVLVAEGRPPSPRPKKS